MGFYTCLKFPKENFVLEKLERYVASRTCTNNEIDDDSMRIKHLFNKLESNTA